MRICVVDDEKEVRTSIIQKLYALFPEIEVFDVGFGQQAVQEIQFIRPDVVLLDIRMPIINGLDMLQWIKENFSQIYVIIISGYDDFEYAKKALHFGALDYMLKPVNRKELKETIHKIEHHQVERFLQEIQVCFMKSMVSAFSFQDVQIIPKQVSFWFDERIPKKLQLKMDSLSLNNESGKVSSAPIIFSYSINDIIKGDCIISDELDGTPIFREKEDFFEQLQMQYEKSIQLRFFEVSALDQLSLHDDRDKMHQLASLRNRMLDEARNNNMEQVQCYLNEWFSVIEKIPYRMLIKESAYLLAILDEGFTKPKLIVVDDDLLHYWMSWVAKHVTITHLRHHMKSLVIRSLQEWIRIEVEQDMGEQTQWFDKAFYIIESSKDLNINLEAVAEMVGVHPVTLSRMFKQKVGINFIQYLTNRRLETAKELIVATDKKIMDIALEIGYSDYPYFRNLFKKRYHDSPSDYRKKHAKSIEV